MPSSHPNGVDAHGGFCTLSVNGSHLFSQRCDIMAGLRPGRRQDRRRRPSYCLGGVSEWHNTRWAKNRDADETVVCRRSRSQTSHRFVPSRVIVPASTGSYQDRASYMPRELNARFGRVIARVFSRSGQALADADAADIDQSAAVKTVEQRRDPVFEQKSIWAFGNRSFERRLSERVESPCHAEYERSLRRN